MLVQILYYILAILGFANLVTVDEIIFLLYFISRWFIGTIMGGVSKNFPTGFSRT